MSSMQTDWAAFECQMMGGDITVASEPGKGSVFTVRLPGGGPRMYYFGFATRRRMVATKDSNSIGLATNSSQPEAMAFSRSLSSA